MSFSFAFLLVCSLVVDTAVYGNNGKIKEYSAERTAIRPDGQVQDIRKLFVAPDKIRMEMSSFIQQGQMINIYRQDKKVIWTLFPEKKLYIEGPLHEYKFQQFFHQMGKNVDEENLGSERIMGYNCRKKRVETTMQLMGSKVKRWTIVWKSDKFDLPLRTQGENGLITELRNIKIGHQQDSLFGIPPGYQKASTIFQAIGSTGGIGKSKDSSREEHSEKETGLPSGSP